MHGLLQGLALAATLGASVASGLPQGPAFDPVLFWLGKLVGRTYAASPAVFYGTWAVIAAATLLLSALPYLIAHRLAPRFVSRTVGRFVWLAGAALLAAPAIQQWAEFE